MERADINRIKSQLIDRRERLHQAAKHPETGFKFIALLKKGSRTALTEYALFVMIRLKKIDWQSIR